MPVIQINPDALFSTDAVARMLDIDGLTSHRIRRICEQGLLPNAQRNAPADNPGGRYTHWRIPFKDFEAVVEGHQTLRSARGGGNPRYPTIAQFNELAERLSVLEQVVDEYTATEVASTHAPR